MLILLSGPPAAGKSTIGSKLAKRFLRSVNFSLDTIRDFVKGGYVAPWEDTDEEGQMSLATQISIEMTRRYLAKDFVVIVDSVFHDEDVELYKKEFPETYAFLLLPSREVLHSRDQQRPPDQQLPTRVDAVHKGFTERPNKLMTTVDSSLHSVEETVQTIIESLPK